MRTATATPRSKNDSKYNNCNVGMYRAEHLHGVFDKIRTLKDLLLGASVICRMLNAERDYSIQGQRKNVYCQLFFNRGYKNFPFAVVE